MRIIRNDEEINKDWNFAIEGWLFITIWIKPFFLTKLRFYPFSVWFSHRLIARAKGKAPITIIIYLNSELGTNAKKSTDVHFCLREGFNGQETIAAAKSELELSLQSILKANNWSMENLKNKWTSISWNLSPPYGHVILAWSADNHFWQLSIDHNIMSIIKLNTGCRLSNKLKKYHFTLFILWCRQMGRPTGVRSHDYQNFSDAWIAKFSYLWCFAAHVSCVQELRFKCCIFENPQEGTKSSVEMLFSAKNNPF